jgi:hypothetical protein
MRHYTLKITNMVMEWNFENVSGNFHVQEILLMDIMHRNKSLKMYNYKQFLLASICRCARNTWQFLKWNKILRQSGKIY